MVSASCEFGMFVDERNEDVLVREFILLRSVDGAICDGGLG